MNNTRLHDWIYAFTIVANITSVTLSLVTWRQSYSAVGVALGAVAITAIILVRKLGQARLVQLQTLIRQSELDVALKEELLSKMRSGEASVEMEGRLVRTM